MVTRFVHSLRKGLDEIVYEMLAESVLGMALGIVLEIVLEIVILMGYVAHV